MAAALVLTGLLFLTWVFPMSALGLVDQWWGSTLNPAYLPMALHNLNRLLVVGILSLLVFFLACEASLPG